MKDKRINVENEKQAWKKLEDFRNKIPNILDEMQDNPHGGAVYRLVLVEAHSLMKEWERTVNKQFDDRVFYNQYDAKKKNG